MGKGYNAPMLSDKIIVNDVGTVIDCDVNTSEYICYLFDNLGDNQAQIVIAGAIIKLEKGMHVIVEQDEISSITIKAEAGKTTDVLYVIQGYTKIV